MSSSAIASLDSRESTKQRSTRTTTRSKALNSIPVRRDTKSQSPSAEAIQSNAWKQVKIERAREAEEDLLEQCESFYQLILQRLSGSKTGLKDLAINNSIPPPNLSAAPIDLTAKCSRVGSRYQADLPPKLSAQERLKDKGRYPEHDVPLIAPAYWTPADQTSNESCDQTPLPDPAYVDTLTGLSNNRPRCFLRGGNVSLGNQTLTREQEYQVRYLNSPPAFPAFEFVRSKLCSPLALKYRAEILRKRARAAEARLGLVRVGRGRRSTRINPALLPPVKPKEVIVDTSKQIPIVWERMLNTGGHQHSKDGRAKLAQMVHDVTKDRDIFYSNDDVEVVEMPIASAPSRSKKQKTSHN